MGDKRKPLKPKKEASKPMLKAVETPAPSSSSAKKKK